MGSKDPLNPPSTWTITALKKGYKTVKQAMTLEAGEEKDIEVVMK